MQVTFLIGNGFDLGIGLKTAYSDFYRVYCAETQKDDENLRNFKSAIQLNQKRGPTLKMHLANIQASSMIQRCTWNCLKILSTLL